jgi:hypothetical protein
VADLCLKLQKKYPGSDIRVQEEDPKGESPKKRIRSKDNPVDEKKEQEQESQKEPRETASTTRNPGIRIFPSSDPGRFVCNYIYCYSLNRFCQTPAAGNDEDDPSRVSQPKHKFASLFLHVPPITVIPQDEQLKFVVELMKVIRHQLLSRKR